LAAPFYFVSALSIDLLLGGEQSPKSRLASPAHTRKICGIPAALDELASSSGRWVGVSNGYIAAMDPVGNAGQVLLFVEVRWHRDSTWPSRIAGCPEHDESP